MQRGHAAGRDKGSRVLMHLAMAQIVWAFSPSLPSLPMRRAASSCRRIAHVCGTASSRALVMRAVGGSSDAGDPYRLDDLGLPSSVKNELSGLSTEEQNMILSAVGISPGKRAAKKRKSKSGRSTGAGSGETSAQRRARKQTAEKRRDAASQASPGGGGASQAKGVHGVHARSEKAGKMRGNQAWVPQERGAGQDDMNVNARDEDEFLGDNLVAGRGDQAFLESIFGDTARKGARKEESTAAEGTEDLGERLRPSAGTIMEEEQEREEQEEQEEQEEGEERGRGGGTPTPGSVAEKMAGKKYLRKDKTLGSKKKNDSMSQSEHCRKQEKVRRCTLTALFGDDSSISRPSSPHHAPTLLTLSHAATQVRTSMMYEMNFPDEALIDPYDPQVLMP